MKYKFLLSLYGALFTNILMGQAALPKIKEVVERFYLSYELSSLTNPSVQFQKRKEGWYVVTLKGPSRNTTVDSSYFFYSLKGKKFLPLNLPKVKDSKKIKYNTYVNDYDDMNYEIQPYYGYLGWYKDVINELQKKAGLNDNQLYALGRAYSVYAHTLIYGDHYFTQGYEPGLPVKRNSLSDRQVKAFDSISSLGINCFHLLAKRNPAYKSTFDNISTKYPDEVMSTFETFLIFADDHARSLRLPDGLYNDSALIRSKEFLNGCPQNAIFLSFGDRDYYPLLYLQQHIGFRTDVFLININKLDNDQYSYMITQPRFGSAPLRLSVDSSYYINWNNWYLRLKPAEKPMDFHDVIDAIRGGAKNQNNETEIQGNRFVLPIKHDSSMSSGFGAKIAVDKKVLFKDEWLLLDIINNLKDRKLCMLYNFREPLGGLNHFLRFNGIVYLWDN